MDAPAKSSQPVAPVAPATTGAPATAKNPPNNPTPQSAGVHPTLPVGTSAGTLAVKHGGDKGGRKRSDGLVPGSAEALEADRKRDAQRKKDARRAVSEQRVPEPLPPKIVQPVDTLQPMGGGPLPVDGLAPLAVEPWRAEDVNPAVIQTIQLAMEAEKLHIEGKLKKANIPVSEWNAALETMKWPEMSVKAFKDNGASASARFLTWMGIDRKYKDVINVCPAFLWFIIDRMKAYKRLDELVAAAQPAQPPKKP